MVEARPSFRPFVTPGNGAWVYGVEGSDGTGSQSTVRGCTEHQAWLLATGLAAQMSLREEIRTIRERGWQLLNNPELLRGQGGGKLFKWIQALDAVECFADRRHELRAFRASKAGTGDKARRADSHLNVSPWARTLDPAAKDYARHRAWLQTLARAFPEFAWSDDLR